MKWLATLGLALAGVFVWQGDEPSATACRAGTAWSSPLYAQGEPGADSALAAVGHDDLRVVRSQVVDTGTGTDARRYLAYDSAGDLTHRVVVERRPPAAGWFVAEAETCD